MTASGATTTSPQATDDSQRSHDHLSQATLGLTWTKGSDTKEIQ